MSALHHLRYFAEDAWDEWKHSPGVNLLAGATLTAALFLAGLGLLVVHNVREQVEQQRRAVPVEVYLTDDLTAEDRGALEQRLAGEAGVSRVDYVDKEAARARFRAQEPELADLIVDLEHNPLPASLEVFLEPGPGAEATANRIVLSLDGVAGVEDVRFDFLWLARLQELVEALRRGGAGAAIAVLVAVVLVMASVLRLAVYARRDEIEIMLLVGATPGFVRGPFLVAGIAQGLAASAVALGLVELARRATLSRLGDGSMLPDLLAARSLPGAAVLLVVATGLAVSLIGSFFAVRVRALG